MKQFNKVVMANISKSMEDEVAKTVRVREKRAIAKVVYRRYIPNSYTRRYSDGGLIANENIKSSVGVSDKNARLSVYNVTKANTSQKNYGRVNGGYLTPLIVLGHEGHKSRYGGMGYSWYPRPIYKSELYAMPRDFISETKRDLKDSQAHMKALEKGLQKRRIIQK